MSLRRAIGAALRRAVAAPTAYGWATCCDRPVERMALASVFASNRGYRRTNDHDK